MTKQEKDKIIKELRKKFIKEIQNELELLVAKTEQPKRWKPKCGETYSYITYEGRIWGTHWTNETGDNWGYLIGNCFKTKEEAEEHKKQIEYTARYKNYIEEHSEPIDWSNSDQCKYSPTFSFRNKEIKIGYSWLHKTQGIIYASSEQVILDAIKEIGFDNFKKYVLEVK